MSEKPIKITFSVDEKDAIYFKRLLRDARKYAKGKSADEIIAAAQQLVEAVRESDRVPLFALEAMKTLECLIAMVGDNDFALPKATGTQVLAALAYFVHPQDLIPDDVPALGFLDDAILIKIVEREFSNELWGYQKFVKFRDGSGQRSWIATSEKRLPARVIAKRKEIRAQIDQRNARADNKGWLW